jgi:hypothetical protein
MAAVDKAETKREDTLRATSEASLQYNRAVAKGKVSDGVGQAFDLRQKQIEPDKTEIQSIEDKVSKGREEINKYLEKQKAKLQKSEAEKAKQMAKQEKEEAKKLKDQVCRSSNDERVFEF